MPDTALIDALEQMRDTYSQRQKATNNLLSALKGTTGAIGKTTRSLKEYLDQAATLDGGAVAEAQQAFGALRLKDEVVDPLLPDLRREVKTLASVTTALKDALAALRGESVDVVKLGHAHRALVATMQGARIQDPALATILPPLERELQEAQRSLGETFGQALRHAMRELGVEIVGRPPRFEIGRFDINADFVNRTASISYGKDLISRRVPLSVEAVIKAYQRETKAIMGRNEDGDRWIEQFYNAWQLAQRRRAEPGRPLAERANIVECYFELVLLRQGRAFRIAPSKHNLVDYSRAQFAYDFFEFAIRQRLSYDGRRVQPSHATKSQAESADRRIWIVQGESPNDGHFYGDIVFTDR